VALVAISVTIGTDTFTVSLGDGGAVDVPYARYPRLAAATPAQRRHWRLIAGGEGIHWLAIDEHLSVAGLVRDASGQGSP
jgi:hypothetical protein